MYTPDIADRVVLKKSVAEKVTSYFDDKDQPYYEEFCTCLRGKLFIGKHMYSAFCIILYDVLNILYIG